jgi:two-component system sensor histidine kinase QseC
VRSLQWRMLAALVLVIVLAWTMSISMFVAFMTSGRQNFWQVHLHALGNTLVSGLPDSWVQTKDKSATQQHDTEPASPTQGAAAVDTAPSAEKPSQPSRIESADPGGILTAILLNTLELALVGILMWWAVVRSLRPLKAISMELGQRKVFDSTPLPVNKLPDELRPLIVAFNVLLKRVDDAMRVEHQFIADAAHELRTPLAALHVQAEVALRADTQERKDDALRKLLEISRRSHRLAEQLLDLARMEAGLHATGLLRTDLFELSRHVIDEFSVQARNRGTQLILSGSSCLASCDIDEIGILIRNLVDNAIRHGYDQGAVEVRCGYTLRGDGRRPMLEVRDDGPGVPEEEQTAIFARFYRAAGSAARGSGIGLSLVAGIAELHGATIETGMGNGGRGFCVRVVFPREA